MKPPQPYNVAFYSLPREFVRELTTLEPWRSMGGLALVWLEVGLLLWCARSAPGWTYPIFAILVAGRQGALLQLIHEGAHGLLLPSRAWNHAVARWLCAYPIGIFFDGYTQGHLRHHLHTNTPKDPPSDREKYRVTDFADPRLYLLFLKDLLGLTALSIFFSYKGTEDDAQTKGQGALAEKLLRLAGLCLVQTVILGVIFRADILAYIYWWIIPAMSPHMFLMRIRGIAEHGLAYQLGQNVTTLSDGTYFTRSFLTPVNRYRLAPLRWLEKCLIGSFSVHYHHEHHLCPTVPFYHLAKLHARLAPQVSAVNPDIYAAGYFSAALRGLAAAPLEVHA